MLLRKERADGQENKIEALEKQLQRANSEVNISAIFLNNLQAICNQFAGNLF